MAVDEKAQQEYQRRLEKYSKNTGLEIDAAILSLLSNHAGRKFLWWLLEIGQVNTQPFRGDPERTAFACGELNVGNRIQARIVTLSADGYVNMLKESQNERLQLSVEPDSADRGAGEPGAYEQSTADYDNDRDE